MWNLFCSYGAALLVYHETSLEDTYETSVHNNKHGIKIIHFSKRLKAGDISAKFKYGKTELLQFLKK